MSEGDNTDKPENEPAPWRTIDTYVSLYNFESEAMKGFSLPKKVTLHDVTLRDGEQQAGIVFTAEDKVRIARALDEAGVERIEAGLPSVSPEDMSAIKEITHLGLDAKIFAFARCMKQDVDNALEADVDGIVMEIPASDHLIKYAYGWEPTKSIELATEATSYAHDHGLYVTFFTIDASRTRFDVFWKLVGSVASQGHMDSLTVADTFGVMNPQGCAYFISKLKALTSKPIEIHTHNDFGLGVANTLAALSAGAETAHVTVNGIGERSGNTSLEEVAMALSSLYRVETNVKLEKLRSLSRLVRQISGVETPPQKAVVGDGLFSTESGIGVAWWKKLESMKMPLEMYPFTPEKVGHDPIKIVLGKKSGRDSIIYMAEKKLGVKLREEQADLILSVVKSEAIKRRRALTEKEFAQLVASHTSSIESA